MARRKSGRRINGILLLDKPTAISSNQALQKVRYLFKARKAGHTGTLDPLATGMLPLCFGEATKLSSYLLSSAKAYTAHAVLGSITDTGDADGTVIEERPVDDSSLNRLPDICRSFAGEIEQVPPMYSALKVDGQRLYKLAREGKSVKRDPRKVTIHTIDLVSADQGQFCLDVTCSSGTYIRSLVEDIGSKLGCGAHLTALRRRWVSPFEANKMTTLASVEALLPAPLDGVDSTGEHQQEQDLALQELDKLLLPMDFALQHLPAIKLDDIGYGRFKQGQSVGSDDPAVADCDGAVRVYSHDVFVGLGQWRDGQFHPVRVFNLQ